MRKVRLACAPLVASVFAVSGSLQAGETAVPSGVSYQHIGTYSVERLNAILTTEREAFSDFPVAYAPALHPVKLYRVTYPSVIPERNNRPTVASGLLALPDVEGKRLPIVSYQHGTVFSRTEVPSHPDESMETRLMVAVFAGQGYGVVAADYFGRGLSPETDSYLVKESTQQACLDMLRAAQAVAVALKKEPGPLFLSGWSQGGWATMVFLNKLESVGIPVKAAATASAPMDLFAIINRWIHAPEAGDAVFLPALLALQLNACEEYYGLPGLAASALKPEYQKAARDLYLNKVTWEESKLPQKVGELLREDFVTASSLGETRYGKILQDGQAYRWRSQTPLRIYYGGADEVVPPFIATLPVGYQKVMGGAETTGQFAGATANHRGTFLHAVSGEKKWFDGMTNDE